MHWLALTMASMFEARRPATPEETERLIASVDVSLTPAQQAQLEAAEISVVSTRSELGALFTVLGVTAPKQGAPTQRTVAECAAEWAAGGGTEHDDDSYRRGIARTDDPGYRPELLFTPSTLASSGYLLMDAVHRAAALFTRSGERGTEQLDNIAYVLPRPFVVNAADRGYPASEMGPKLLEYVERALLDDLRHYGIAPEGLRIDWSDPVQEGHVTHYLDGMLEEMSDVIVLGADGSPRADGWIDFVHGEPDAPLFVFWSYLRRRDGDRWISLKDRPTLPAHLWVRLPERSKELCATQGRYDAHWADDPLVAQWRTSRR